MRGIVTMGGRAFIASLVGSACCTLASACTKSVADAGAEAAPPPDATLDGSSGFDAAEAGRGSLIKLGATAQTSVLDAPWWPESGKGSKRIGYLRHGATVAAYERPQVNDDCKDGWFELEVGGYVCGKAASADLASARVRLAPRQPDHDAGMPYRYGVNVQDGTPLYRRVLPTEERKKYEPWLVPAKPAADDGAGSADNDKTEKAEAVDEESPSGPRKTAGFDAGLDAGRPKLKSLKGRGVLVRTMARGFYLALDRSFTTSGARWWRTSFGFAVPFERIVLQPGVTKYMGSWFDTSAAADRVVDAAPDDGGVEAGNARTTTPTVGFVNVGFARKLELSDDEKKVTWGAELPKRSGVLLDGRQANAGGVTVHHTTAGFWVRLTDLTVAHPVIPADLRPHEKWIDVDLGRQALVAFEGTRPVFATLISSGRRNPQDKERDFPTPTGTYRIHEKHVTTTMDGDVASDGPYSIEDVPWVMYFQGSYALHGAFWHDSFGNKRSHGCVNMAPEDARSLFAWSDPPLPAGWHGVFSRDESSGTRVVVHEDAPPKRVR